MIYPDLLRPVETIKRLVINIIRSVLFLASFTQSIFLIQCYGGHFLPSATMTTLNRICAAVSGFGIAFEQPHKRVDITYFCVPKSLEALWNLLEKRNLVRSIPGQEVNFCLLYILDHCIHFGYGNTWGMLWRWQ